MPLIVNLTGGTADTGWITARGTHGVYLSFVDASGSPADAYIREIGSRQGGVSISARSLIDAQPDLDFAKIGGKDIVLTATGGGIGPMLISQYVGGSLEIWAAGDVSLRNAAGPLNVAGLYAEGNVDLTAYLDLTITGDFTSSGSTTLASVFGKLDVKDALMGVSGDATFIAASDIMVSDSDLNIAGIWNVIGNSITMLSTDVAAQETSLTTMGGDLIIEGGSANLGDTHVSSVNNVSISDWYLNVLGTLNVDSVNDLLVLGSNVKATDTTLNAANGDLTITGGTFDLANALLTSGNNVTISDVPQFNVGKYFGIKAKNRLTLKHVTGKAEVADFQASGFSLIDWHIFSDEMWLNGVDIYNDPAFRNSLTSDRIIRVPAVAEEEEEEEDEEEPVLSGYWLSANSTNEDLLKTLQDLGTAILPISESSLK